jgi:hypothetical protein
MKTPFYGERFSNSEKFMTLDELTMRYKNICVRWLEFQHLQADKILMGLRVATCYTCFFGMWMGISFWKITVLVEINSFADISHFLHAILSNKIVLNFKTISFFTKIEMLTLKTTTNCH